MLDDAKHYWVSPDEVDKLIRAGAGWLAAHPRRRLITRRYLAHRPLTRAALARLAEVDDTEPEQLRQRRRPRPKSATSRTGRSRSPSSGAARCSPRCAPPAPASVADLGCGEGALVRACSADRGVRQVVAADVSARALEIAARKLRLDRMPEQQRQRVELFQSSLTYRDDRLAGLDAAVLMEVIEHVDPPRLAALERCVFGHAAPANGRRHHAERRAQRAVRDAAARSRSATATTASSGPASEFQDWARAGRRRATATPSASCRWAPTTRRSARRPSWPSSPSAATPRGGRMTAPVSTTDAALNCRPGAQPGRAGRRRPGRASPPSPASTSRPPR